MGDIENFKVTVTPGDIEIMTKDGGTTEQAIENLEPFKEYTVGISTKNKGFEEYSTPKETVISTLPSRKSEKNLIKNISFDG